MRRWRALAILGRVGRALGFRWVFPIGTLPVPFHPAFLPLVLATLVVWTASSLVGLVSGASDGAGGSVVGLVVGFGVVGRCCRCRSSPGPSWRWRSLVQALLALAAMLVLSVSVAAGDDPPWLAVLPAAYAVTWATQAIGGVALGAADARPQVRRSTSAAAVVLPADIDSAACGPARPLRRRRCVAAEPRRRDGGRGRVVVTPDQAAQLREASRDALPGTSRSRTSRAVRGLAWPDDCPDNDAVVVHVDRGPTAAGSSAAACGGSGSTTGLSSPVWPRSVLPFRC